MSVPGVLITISGGDRPGVTAAVTAALAECVERVVDVEQIVIRDRLTLALLCQISATTSIREVELLVAEHAAGLHVDVTPTDITAAAPVDRESFVVTVLAVNLGAAALAEVASAIASAGGNIERIRRTADYPVTALQLHVSLARGTASAQALRAGLLGSVGSHGVDLAVQRADLDQHGARLVVLDVDSTLVQAEGIDALAAAAGVGDEVSAITAAAMRGELDYQASLEQRVRLLAGLPAETLAQVATELPLSPGARTLIRTLQHCGDHVALVSGGFEELIRPHAEELSIKYVRANRLEVTEGRLTGRVIPPVVDRQGKADALQEFAAALGVPQRRTVAVGDGANDLDMLAAAGLGIAFNAKPVVQAAADATLNVPYLDAVLYMLGITREQIEDADTRAGVMSSMPAVR